MPLPPLHTVTPFRAYFATLSCRHAAADADTLSPCLPRCHDTASAASHAATITTLTRYAAPHTLRFDFRYAIAAFGLMMPPPHITPPLILRCRFRHFAAASCLLILYYATLLPC